MKELKECPFCGGKVDWCKNDKDMHIPTDDCHYIVCERCGEFCLNMPDINFPKVYYAIADQWNTRTSIPISKIEELKNVYSHRFGDRLSSMSVQEDLQKLIDEDNQ